MNSRFFLLCRVQTMLLLSTLTTVMAASPLLAADDLALSGFLKSLNIYGEAAPAGLLPHYKLSSNRLRLDVTGHSYGQFNYEVSLDHQAVWSNPGGLSGPQRSGYNRYLDLDKEWQHSDIWSSRTQLDRLNLGWHSDRFHTTVGRQAIGFGRIVLFSPLDVIAPFAPDALDTDVRPGIDAIRASISYGLDGEFSGVFVWGENSHYDSYLVTWSDNHDGIDFLAIGGSLRDRPMFGFGLAGNLGSLGLKGEIAFYEGQRTNRPDGDLHDDFSIGAVEAWYRFDMGLTLIAQYLYNGPGAHDPGGYYAAAESAPLQEGLTYLLARHYLMLAPSYEPHPLVTLNGLLIWNLEDDSSLFRPTLVLSLADNASLELFWTFNNGDKPSAKQAFPPPKPQSEFGLRGDNGGLFLKLFF